MTVSALLAAKNLGRQVEGGEWLIRHIDMEVHAGDRLAIVGPSGSGKTVLLRALALLDPVSEGTVLFDGQPVSGSAVPACRTRVAYLQQRASMFEGTVEDNLRKPFGLAVHAGKQFDRTRIAGWLDGLGRGADFLVKDQQNLSGGESQIAALLRTMQLEPQVLLLDEPTSALDEASTTAVETLLERWLAETPTGAIVWITHSSEQANRMCNRVLHMDGGQLSDGND